MRKGCVGRLRGGEGQPRDARQAVAPTPSPVARPRRVTERRGSSIMVLVGSPRARAGSGADLAEIRRSSRNAVSVSARVGRSESSSRCHFCARTTPWVSRVASSQKVTAGITLRPRLGPVAGRQSPPSPCSTPRASSRQPFSRGRPSGTSWGASKPSRARPASPSPRAGLISALNRDVIIRLKSPHSRHGRERESSGCQGAGLRPSRHVDRSTSQAP